MKIRKKRGKDFAGAEAPKKWEIKFISIITAVLFAVTCALTACGMSPDKLFINAEKGLFETFKTNLETIGAQAEKPLSTDLDIGIDIGGSITAEDSQVSDLIKKMALSLKIDSRPDEKLFYAAIGFDGSDILTGTLTQDKNGPGIYLPELDEHYYIMSDFNKLWGKITGDDTGEDSADTEFTPVRDLKAAGKACLKRYFKYTTASVTKENVTLKNDKNIELSLLNKTVEKCRLLTFTPTEEDFSKLISGIAEELKDDTDLALFLASAAERNPLISVMVKTALKEAAYEGNNNYERILNALNKLSDEIKEHVSESAGEFAKEGLSLQLVLNKNDEIIRQAIIAEDKDVLVYETNKEKDKTDMAFMFAQEDYATKITIEKTGLSNNKLAFSAVAESTYGGETEAKITFKSDELDLSRKSALMLPYGKITFSFEDEYTDNINLTLTVGVDENGGSSHKITFGEGGISVQINIRSTDKPCTAQKPDKSKLVDISDYTDEQLEEILDGIRDSVSSIIMSLAMSGLFG